MIFIDEGVFFLYENFIDAIDAVDAVVAIRGCYLILITLFLQ